MKENTLVLWIAVSKQNKMLLFGEEPQRSAETGTGWTGTLYVNSIIYDHLEKTVKQSDMTYSSEPEMITFTIK